MGRHQLGWQSPEQLLGSHSSGSVCDRRGGGHKLKLEGGVEEVGLWSRWVR